MKRGVYISTLALVLSSITGHAAAAGFMNNGDAWERLPPQLQAAYIEGINDSSNLVFINDDLSTAIVKVARTRCLAERKTTAANLASEVTNVYVNNKAMAQQPPIVVYLYVMTATCKDFINQERHRLGLPPS